MVDRRVNRTRVALKKSFIQLLKVSELSSISVKQLTDTADINRSTFYKHFDDIYSIYEWLEDEAVAELSEVIESYGHCKTIGNCPISMYEKLLLTIKAEPVLYQLMFNEKKGISFISKLGNQFHQLTLRKEIKTDEELMMRNYILYGMIGMIKAWIDKYMEMQVTDMASLLKQSVDKSLG
ncbi:TetR/AcrR family transcriptional regulator C-terminal domain-containing protein [Photobacterium sp. BZF1]|uniref:TetR/AcrR family transcriptional regulator n=1 Tax=Photobacterium sp. BZF1 TaxID=1904457 RepID=UPI0016536452|nr:TetR/AcrR family transcriptional regulator [Photobacterium sp. BZF1]MBC7006755.1 TetR/AcrR family transcriptional regulator C-terminal domain-containing protein [Photobacterium sp. BZF1]